MSQLEQLQTCDIRRIIVIDDNTAIHDDFRKTLCADPQSSDLAEAEAALFGTPAPAAPRQTQFQIDSAYQGEEGSRLVQQALSDGKPYALAFVDMRMPPGWDGVQTIENLWKHDPDLQVVICTAYSDYSWEQIVQKLGTTDRLLILRKPFDAIEVCQLAAALTEKWNVTRQARLNLEQLQELVRQRTEEIQQAALRDKLTGLANRALLNDRLRQSLLRAKREQGRKFAVLFLDFDRFKVVNDSLGHEIGDLLLVSMAQRLRQAVRLTDTIASQGAQNTAARLGGDEFVVLLDRINHDADAVRVAERLLSVLAEPCNLKGHEVRCTVSIGITTSTLGYEQADDMLRDADTAMYCAKASGKARAVMFDPTMHADALARLTFENELRRAIANQELLLHYQPQVCLRTGRVLAVEALVRWQHPEKGIISPAVFIPLAEETGLIVPLGRWVMQRACEQLATWLRDGACPENMSMSVNLSPCQMASPDLLPDIAQILAQTKINPASLTLEITESAMFQDMEQAVRTLTQITQSGVRLHLDDFGTGYSSLSCLHKFPLSGLKLDRTFIENIRERYHYADFIDAMVKLAHALKMEVIAEGVETADQAMLLHCTGCDLAQGYYFARPMDATAVTARLRGTIKHPQPNAA